MLYRQVRRHVARGRRRSDRVTADAKSSKFFDGKWYCDRDVPSRSEHAASDRAATAQCVELFRSPIVLRHHSGHKNSVRQLILTAFVGGVLPRHRVPARSGSACRTIVGTHDVERTPGRAEWDNRATGYHCLRSLCTCPCVTDSATETLNLFTQRGATPHTL